jgi:hypothetical protein
MTCVLIQLNTSHTTHIMIGVNKKPTNAFIIQCTGTQYSTTCFGTLKCHHHGVKHDPVGIGVQCRGKQRRLGAAYCNRRRGGRDIPTVTYPSRIMFDALMMAF